METSEVSFNRWLAKEGAVHIHMEYYSAIGKDEILPFATTWMDLENMVLSEISQSEKAKNHIISLLCEL